MLYDRGNVAEENFFFFFQAEDGIRDRDVTGFRRVLFRSRVPSSLVSPFALPKVRTPRFLAYLSAACIFRCLAMEKIHSRAFHPPARQKPLGAYLVEQEFDMGALRRSAFLRIRQMTDQ